MNLEFASVRDVLRCCSFGAAVPMLLHYSMACCWLVMCTLLVGCMLMVGVYIHVIYFCSIKMLLNFRCAYANKKLFFGLLIYICYSVNYKYQVGVLGI